MIDMDERAPHLAAVIVGEDPASQTYVGSKEKIALLLALHLQFIEWKKVLPKRNC